MTHPQNGAIQHSFEQRMAFEVGSFPLIAICVFSGRDKLLFHGFDEEFNSFLLSSISQFEVGDDFRFEVPNWRSPIIAINEGPPIVALINTFGLNWNNISSFHIY